MRHAAYLGPAVLVLQRQTEASVGVSCKPNGSPCVVNSECCTDCCAPNMMGTLKCMGSMNCP
ncbi:MAG: hypothetical protein KJO43_00985 [Phycisphaerae bacterium]|nr:hypothetical protein [Phycisphaerae bacterium]NNF44732.1 hypothetical protein [Phycisphaerales bacterium]